MAPFNPALFFGSHALRARSRSAPVLARGPLMSSDLECRAASVRSLVIDAAVVAMCRLRSSRPD